MEQFGKKVFFLYPHSVIQEDLITHIIQNEFEVYLINDHRTLLPLLKKYNNSILFINIDERLKESEWEEYIRSIMNNEATMGVQIGILTYNEDKELARKYLMDLMVPGGYIQLKLGLKESTKIILKTLMANEAKGKRKFVRANCPKGIATEFNVQVAGSMYEGTIKDISSAGMAVYFNKSVDLPPRTELSKIQLKLRSRIVMVSGIIVGMREDQGHKMYVLLFNRFISTDAKQRISSFIYRTLQAELQRELDNVK
jgi:hypothetical protein